MRLAVLLGALFATPPDLPVPLGLDPYMQVPPDSPLTRPVVELGRRLFRDPALSRDGKVSCASCHDATLSFTDGKPVAEGIDQIKGKRSSPTLINRGYGTSFFWDGRAGSLEQQALQPILSVIEMDTPLDEIPSRLRKAGYTPAFRAVFSRDPNTQDLARTLASYVRTIRSGDSRFDRHIAGQRGILTAVEQAGLDLFSSKARCWFCHTGSNFTDEQFHNTGVAWKNNRYEDDGRAAITHRFTDRGAFKTPTLRDIARTAPYMHDGSVPTLEEVVEFYDRGGNRNPLLDPAVQPLQLTAAEKHSLIAFLKTLTGEVREGW
jgi:cytochrome c peroxidase